MKKLLPVALLAVMSLGNAFAVSSLSDAIPYPFYEVQKAQEGYSNKMMVLNSGIAAFEKRLEIIDKAQKNIEVEYFIYALDSSAKMMTNALIRAAQRGVNVRILVDKSSAIFVLDEYYAKVLKEKNVQVKYYNTAMLLRLSSINFRNHRKLLSVDDQFAITGGRNVEDDYFDFSPEFNFIDRDVYIEGDIVKTMRKSFDEYYNSDIADTPEYPERPSDTIKRRIHDDFEGRATLQEIPNTKAIKKYEAKMKLAYQYATLSEDDKALQLKARTLGKKVLSSKKLHVCPQTTYSTDRPGGNFFTRLFDDYSDDYRYLRKTLFDKGASVDKGIIISSPYMINSPKSLELYGLLLDRNVDVQLYTNSLASTDAVYVAANLYRTVFNWANRGIKTSIHSGEFIPETEMMNEEIKKAKWGTHSKTQLYEYHNEENEFMIGTYNVDNRSNHYNSEMAIFCKGNPELYKEVKDNVMARINEGYKLHKNITATNKDGKKVSIFGSNKDDLALMAALYVPSWLLNLLL